MEKEKELVWLPKELADKVKEIQGDKNVDLLITRFIEDSKREIQANLESLEDDVLRYKGLMLNAKKAFEDAKNEQLSASYALWEKIDEELPSVKAKTERLIAELRPVSQEIEKINNMLRETSKYQIEDLLKVVKKIAEYLSYDSKTGEILKFLFDNYKKKES